MAYDQGGSYPCTERHTSNSASCTKYRFLDRGIHISVLDKRTHHYYRWWVKLVALTPHVQCFASALISLIYCWWFRGLLETRRSMLSDFIIEYLSFRLAFRTPIHTLPSLSSPYLLLASDSSYATIDMDASFVFRNTRTATFLGLDVHINLVPVAISNKVAQRSQETESQGELGECG